jgi:hypothetical protein
MVSNSLELNFHMKKHRFLTKILFPSRIKLLELSHELGQARSDISDIKWEMLSLKLLCSDEIKHVFREFFSLIEIKSVVGLKKKRFGSDADGGYVMIDNLDGIDCAYSIGVGNEVSWDLELANRGIPVLQYDYSVDGPPVKHDLFTFYKKRISTSKEAVSGSESIDGIIDSHKHYKKKLLLKMDIEGSEWDVLADMKEDSLKLFDQIVIEIHDLSKVIEYPFRESASRALKRLNLHHTPVHVHGNNASRSFQFGDFYFADLMELTYVKSENYSFSECVETFPTALDKPNRTDRPEIYLGHFKAK